MCVWIHSFIENIKKKIPTDASVHFAAELPENNIQVNFCSNLHSSNQESAHH